MPKYQEGARHTSKDGRNWVVQGGQWVEVPQGAEQHEVYDPLEGMSGFDKFAAGAGKAVVDMGRGLGQIVGVVDEEDVAEARERDKALMNTGAGFAGNIVGNVATAIGGGSVLRGAAATNNAARAARATRAGMAYAGPGRASRAVTAAGTALANPATLTGAVTGGAAIGAAQPVAEGESRGMNALAGGAGAAVGHGVASGIGRVIRPTRSPMSQRDQVLARQLQREGVELDALDLTDSRPLEILESVFHNIPLTSGRAAARTEARAGQYTRAAMRAMGSNADRVTPEALRAAGRRLGNQFDAFIQNRPLNVDQQFISEIDGLRRRINSLPEGLRPPANVSSVLDDFAEMGPYVNSGQAPQILTETYQNMNSALAKKARGSAMSDPDVAEYYEAMRDALDGLVERNLGGDALADFRDVRRQYRNYKIIQKAADNTQETIKTGFLNPQDLRAASRTVGKESVVTGRSDLARLSRAGMRFKNMTPNSGTAERAMMQEWMMNPLSLGALGSGTAYAASGDPTTAAALGAVGLATPIAAQRALYSPAMRNYIAHGLLPNYFDPLGQALRVGSTRVGTAGLLTEK